MKKLLSQLVLLAVLTTGVVSFGQSKYKSTEMPLVTKDLNGTTMSSEKSLVDNLSQTENFSQFLKAYKTVENSIANQHEMFTVFVVPNSGFSRFDEDTLKEMFAAKNTDQLKKEVSYHIIPGRVDLHSMLRVSSAGKPVSFRTVDGGILQLKNEGEVVYLVSSDGVKSQITQADFLHNQGYFHVVSEWVLP